MHSFVTGVLRTSDVPIEPASTNTDKIHATCQMTVHATIHICIIDYQVTTALAPKPSVRFCIAPDTPSVRIPMSLKRRDQSVFSLATG